MKSRGPRACTGTRSLAFATLCVGLGACGGSDRAPFFDYSAVRADGGADERGPRPGDNDAMPEPGAPDAGDDPGGGAAPAGGDQGAGPDGGGADAATPSGCTGDRDCDDGAFCNGPERCVDGACEPGAPPDLSDGDDCTSDECDEEADVVVNSATELCADAVFGDDLPDPAWLDGLALVASESAFIGPDPTYPIATDFRDQNHLHAVSGLQIYMWDATIKLQPDDSFLFKIGEAIRFDAASSAFVSFKRPMELLVDLAVTDATNEWIAIRSVDVPPGRGTLHLVSDWTQKIDGEVTEYVALTVYSTSDGGLVSRHRYLELTPLHYDGPPQFTVDRYGRSYIFDKDGARIVSAAGAVQLDVEGWFHSNFLGFAVDDRGVIYMNADDGGSNPRMELIDRRTAESTLLITLDDFRSQASTFVGEAITPPFGRYKALASGIIGATSDDTHTLIYAISAEGEVRFIRDIGQGGFVSAFDYHPDTGAVYMIRDDANRDPELLYNGR